MYLSIFLSILTSIFPLSLFLFLPICLPFEGVVPGGVREKKGQKKTGRDHRGTTLWTGQPRPKRGGCKLRKRGDDSKGRGSTKERWGEKHHEMGTIRCTRDIISLVPEHYFFFPLPNVSSLHFLFRPSENSADFAINSRPKQNIDFRGEKIIDSRFGKTFVHV